MNEIFAVMRLLKALKVRFVNLTFTGLNGALHQQQVTVDRLPGIMEKGVGFDGSSIQGFARIQESDMVLWPMLDTLFAPPWDLDNGNAGHAAAVFCKIGLPNGQPFESDPVFLLQRQINRAAELGFAFRTAGELEFFLFNQGESKPEHSDKVGYFSWLPSGKPGHRVCQQVMLALKKLLVTGEAYHKEVANSQHEIDILHAPARDSAVYLYLLKMAIWEYAVRSNLRPSFMAKPIAGINGSGLHIHMSLWKDGHNAFHDARGMFNLSETARQFTAGLLEHAPAMAAVLASTVNSYKRLVPGYEAPTYLLWGQNNRSALVRVPWVESPNGARVELRCPDPMGNFFLYMTVILAAGLDGIERQLTLGEPFTDDVFEMAGAAREEAGIKSLPGNLAESLQSLAADTALVAALGQSTVNRLTAIGTQQLEAYQQAKPNQLDSETERTTITEWELNRYL